MHYTLDIFNSNPKQNNNSSDQSYITNRPGIFIGYSKQQKMLSKLQQKLMEQHPQMREKRLVLPYYMSLDFPDKQRNIIKWWQEVIQSAIYHSRNVYITPSDLEVIFTIHGLKPVPLQCALRILMERQKLQWRQRTSIIDQQQKQASSFLFQLLQVIFPRKIIKSKLPIHYKALPDPNSKIIVRSYLDQQLRKVKQVVGQEIGLQKNISYQQILIKARSITNIQTKSVDFMLQELENRGWMLIENINGQKIILYSDNARDYNNKNWVSFQKQKLNLNYIINSMENKIQQKKVLQAKNLEMAKRHIQKNEKQKAKKILFGIKQLRNTIQSIQNKCTLIKNQLHELEANQDNIALTQILGETQKIVSENRVDPSLLDDIMEKNQEIKLSQKQFSRGIQQFNEMNEDEDLKEQVDDLMMELEKEMVKDRKDKMQKKNQDPKKIISSSSQQFMRNLLAL